jgi:hypothetical protein
MEESLVGVGGYPVEKRLCCGGGCACVHVGGSELASGFGNDEMVDGKEIGICEEVRTGKRRPFTICVEVNLTRLKLSIAAWWGGMRLCVWRCNSLARIDHIFSSITTGDEPLDVFPDDTPLPRPAPRLRQCPFRSRPSLRSGSSRTDFVRSLRRIALDAIESGGY